MSQSMSPFLTQIDHLDSSNLYKYEHQLIIGSNLFEPAGQYVNVEVINNGTATCRISLHTNNTNDLPSGNHICSVLNKAHLIANWGLSCPNLPGGSPPKIITIFQNSTMVIPYIASSSTLIDFSDFQLVKPERGI